MNCNFIIKIQVFDFLLLFQFQYAMKMRLQTDFRYASPDKKNNTPKIERDLRSIQPPLFQTM